MAGDAAEPELEVKRFNHALAVSLGLFGVGLLIAVVVQVRHGLRPLRRMSEALANMRAGRADRLEAHLPTEIAPLATFYPAEEYHQDYLVKNPNGYCGLGGTGVKFPGES